ncbi:hypothetical protein IWZ01DRAFT_343886 [Phyllosticta capitalensis]
MTGGARRQFPRVPPSIPLSLLSHADLISGIQAGPNGNRAVRVAAGIANLLSGPIHGARRAGISGVDNVQAGASACRPLLANVAPCGVAVAVRNTVVLLVAGVAAVHPVSCLLGAVSIPLGQLVRLAFAEVLVAGIVGIVLEIEAAADCWSCDSGGCRRFNSGCGEGYAEAGKGLSGSDFFILHSSKTFHLRSMVQLWSRSWWSTSRPKA